MFRGWTGSGAPGDKKAQNGSSVGQQAISHSMPQWPQNVITKQKGHASDWNSEHMTVLDREINIF